MLYNVKSLVGFTIGATDGEIGKVEEFYFDDETWTIRYLVVKTGGWLSGRKVLISPSAVNQPDWENEIFPVSLTKEQVKNSPDIDTDKPVSRQQEIELYSHYAWPYYGIAGVGFYGGIGMTGMAETRAPLKESISAQNPDTQSGDPHLRSTSEVKGYQIHATDGEIGEVEDFIMDDNSWTMRFMVVDTGNWFPGKKVLISPRWIRDMKWANSAVYVDLPADAIKNSPEYDFSKPIPEVYEIDLYAYYGRTF
jgi:uncharacterized protein YrrD